MDDIAQQAAELFINEEYEYAIYLYTSIIEENIPNNETLADMYNKRANCYARINKVNDAIEDYKSAISFDKYNSTAYRKLSKCYFAIGNTNIAKDILKESIRYSENKQYDIYEKNNLEEIEIREKQIKNAYEKSEYNRVINLIDNVTKYLELPDICTRHKIMKAKCLIYITKFEESQQIINEILFTNEDNYETIYVRGLNFIYQQKYKLGLEDLKFVLNKCPEAKQLYENYKNIEKLLQKAHNLKLTNLNDAKNKYLQILNIDPKNTVQQKRIFTELAKICSKNKHYSDVILYCTEILIIDKNDLNALKVRVKASQKLGDHEDAIDDCMKIVNLENTDKNKSLLDETKLYMFCSQKIDNYARLGVRSGASMKEIRKAWLKLSKIYHPDKNVESQAEQFIANRKFNRIKKAYEELTKK